jgi:disulfide bond formation protein DsbB
MAISGTSVSLDTAGRTGRVASTVASGWTYAALVVAAAGVAGSLFLSLGMELKACPLCFYQRAFAMSVLGVLAVGLVARGGLVGRLSLLALAPAVSGLGVAIFHVYLEMVGKLECPQGVFGWGTAPKQSLGVFAVLVGLLIADVLRGVRLNAVHWPGTAAAVALGGLLAVASCTSNPPMPSPPKEPYAKSPDSCRPPYHR